MAAELPGFTAQVNLSAAEIKRLADRIITKAKETYDSVAAVPLDKVCLQLVMPLHFTHGAVLWNVAFIWKFICGFGLIYVCSLLSLEKNSMSNEHKQPSNLENYLTVRRCICRSVLQMLLHHWQS